MCLPTSTTNTTTQPCSNVTIKKDNTTLKILVGGLSVTTIGLLASTIVLAGMNNNNTLSLASPAASSTLTSSTGIDFMQSKASSNFFNDPDSNVCLGAKLALENKLCADLEVPSPQAGANVTDMLVKWMLAISSLIPSHSIKVTCALSTYIGIWAPNITPMDNSMRTVMDLMEIGNVLIGLIVN